MSETMKRWRGLRALVEDAVEHGSKAVEKVHRATADRTFTVLEAIPPIATPTKIVHAVHDLSVTTVYTSIRLANKLVGRGVELALDVSEAKDEEPPAIPAPSSDGP